MSNRFRLRGLKVTRVDTVDAGANQDAHILLTKAHDPETCDNPEHDHPKKKKGTAFPEKMAADLSKAFPAQKAKAEKNGGAPAVAGSRRVAAAPPGPRRVAAPAPTRATGGGSGLPSSPAATPAAPTDIPPGEEAPNPKVPPPPTRPTNPNSRLSQISPADFQAVEGKNGTTEWFIPPEKLPEGIEEAVITMIAGPQPTFQWMIDPLAGPPIDGVAKTAAEAFMAMRSALTQSGVANTNLTGPFTNPKLAPPKPGISPGPAAGMNLEALTKDRVLPIRRTLNVIAKGLVESGVFVPSTSGTDLRAILSPQIIDELANVTKSANQSAGYQEVSMADDLEALVEQLPDEVLDYIADLESQVQQLTPGGDDPIAKALASLDPGVAEIFKAQTARLEAAEAALAEEKIAKANAVWINKARSFDGIVDDPGAFGQVLREINDLKPELATAIESVLRAANERVSKGALFAEFGQSSGLASDLGSRVTAITKAYRDADPTMSEEVARAKVWEENPDLYAKHLEEHRQRQRSV